MCFALRDSSVQLGVMLVLLGGSVDKVAEAVVLGIVVQVANLHAVGARPQKSQAYERVNVELLGPCPELELAEGYTGTLPPSP